MSGAVALSSITHAQPSRSIARSNVTASVVRAGSTLVAPSGGSNAMTCGGPLCSAGGRSQSSAPAVSSSPRASASTIRRRNRRPGEPARRRTEAAEKGCRLSARRDSTSPHLRLAYTLAWVGKFPQRWGSGPNLSARDGAPQAQPSAPSRAGSPPREAAESIPPYAVPNLRLSPSRGRREARGSADRRPSGGARAGERAAHWGRRGAPSPCGRRRPATRERPQGTGLALLRMREATHEYPRTRRRSERHEPICEKDSREHRTLCGARSDSSHAAWQPARRSRR